MHLHRPSLRFILSFCLIPAALQASGDYWVVPTYLDGKGASLQGPPEFFWEMEVERLARKYADPDAPAAPAADAPGHADGYLAAEEAADFADALKTGRVKPADPAAAAASHAAARAALNRPRSVIQEAAAQLKKARLENPGAPLPPAAEVPSVTLPLEADSEFADYHKGAAGEPGAWVKLLARPAEERHYRSVWASYMLGVRALEKKDWAEAASRFAACRSLVKEGFADSAGLAAASYGWQGRAELMQGHYPQAARLYLNQLALGDKSAVVSLKRVIPGVMSVYTGSSPGGVPGVEMDWDSPPAIEGPQEKGEELAARWLEAARDPALQELVTAHVLATDTSSYAEQGRSAAWLGILGKAGVEKAPDALRLAWVAYTAGDYKAAEGWLGKGDAGAPLGKWLRSKLALRGGDFATAEKLMAEIAPAVAKLDEQGAPDATYLTTPGESAQGELGGLLYAQGRYPEAFEALVEGGCTNDVTFMAESILTCDELLAAAQKLAASTPAPKPGNTEAEERSTGYVGTLAGRRLILEGRVKEGRPLLSKETREIMDRYIAAAVRAESKKVSAADRARAWWDAGTIMLDQGHEFRGTEADYHKPGMDDNLMREERVKGLVTEIDYSGGGEKRSSAPVFIKVTGAEKKRLAATEKLHARAMRTRMVAAGHILKAAGLLPPGSEQQARALNTAGYWLQDMDNPAADRIYKQLVKTCGKTALGREVDAKRWFKPTTNPWEKDDPVKQ